MRYTVTRHDGPQLITYKREKASVFAAEAADDNARFSWTETQARFVLRQTPPSIRTSSDRWRLRDRQRRNYLGKFTTLAAAIRAADRILAAEANR